MVASSTTSVSDFCGSCLLFARRTTGDGQRWLLDFCILDDILAAIVILVMPLFVGTVGVLVSSHPLSPLLPTSLKVLIILCHVAVIIVVFFSFFFWRLIGSIDMLSPAPFFLQPHRDNGLSTCLLICFCREEGERGGRNSSLKSFCWVALLLHDPPACCCLRCLYRNNGRIRRGRISRRETSDLDTSTPTLYSLYTCCSLSPSRRYRANPSGAASTQIASRSAGNRAFAVPSRSNDIVETGSSWVVIKVTVIFICAGFQIIRELCQKVSRRAASVLKGR
mmetsp:Transcript_19176/g.26651  ORF Transcript_19176/g.26651 Transcript_19176/m.26651 type:complete len:279 (+) Transcript_19176:112-948(+)